MFLVKLTAFRELKLENEILKIRNFEITKIFII
jgi:hypothetical protein